MQASEIRYAHGEEGLAWKDFRTNLEAIDLIRLDGEPQRFRSWIDDQSFGDLLIRRVASDGAALRGERSPSRIRAHREDLIWICLVLKGELRLEQQGSNATLDVDDFAMLDSLQPYVLQTPSTADTLWIGAPRDLVSRHVGPMDGLLSVRMEGRHGVGMIVSRILQAAFTPQLAPHPEADRIANGVLDVLGAAAAGLQRERTPSQYRNAVVRRIRDYVEAHLDDETLTVCQVAAAQGVSSRYLAKIFAAQVETVSDLIWRRRLEKAREALMLRRTSASISDIAFAHGFKNLSHFSKAFRCRFGESPSAVLRGAVRH